MQTTTLNPTITSAYNDTAVSVPITKRFMNWCTRQEENRLMWVGIALASHGCIFTPLTVMAVVFTGTNMILFMLSIIAMGITLVTNLAALPTKISLPLFFFSILMDIAIVIAAIALAVANGYF
jgi:hypothetical protein